MEKRNINISSQVLTSLLLGFLITIIIITLLHFNNNNRLFFLEDGPSTSGSIYANTPTYYNGYSKVDRGSYTCLLGVTHFINCKDITVNEFNNKELTLSEIIYDSFDGHGSLIMIVGFTLSVIIYFFQKVNLKIIKE